MGKMRQYLFEKLSEINYRMTIHEGNANTRLASEAWKIRSLPSSEIPKQFESCYAKLIELIEGEIRVLSNSGLQLSRFTHIQNRTAAKYIKLLFDIESFLRD